MISPAKVSGFSGCAGRIQPCDRFPQRVHRSRPVGHGIRGRIVAAFRDVKVGHENRGTALDQEIDFPEDVTKAEREILPRL